MDNIPVTYIFENTEIRMRFVVLMMVSIKTTVYWDVMSCSLMVINILEKSAGSILRLS
jgi:hypothetical protein